MAGKGSRPRNNYSKEFRKNFDAILWRSGYTDCDYCGDQIKLSDTQKYPNNYIFHKDGTIEHKNCNFN